MNAAAQAWISDRITRYFRAVDARDVERTLALIDGVRLVTAAGSLDDPEPRRAFYARAAAGEATAHVLGSVVVDDTGDRFEYWARYLRFTMGGQTPQLVHVGGVRGAFRLEPGQWIAHEVVDV